MKKCKTAVIVYDYGFINGGAAKVAVESALGLRKRGIEVVYFSAVGPLCAELAKSDIKSICLNMDDINSGKRREAVCRGIWNLKAKRELKKLLTNLDRDSTVVHFHGWSKALSSSVVYAASSMKFRIFVTLHDYFSMCPNGGFYHYQREEICSCMPMSVKCIIANCDKRSYAQKIWRVCRQTVQDFFIRKNKDITYISISELNEKIAGKYLAGKRFYRIKNPVQFGKETIKDIKENKAILYVGRISEEKGIELFCEAIANLLKKDMPVEGVVVGEGEYSSKLIGRYPEIKFVGWKNSNEVQSLMCHARALVFPSKLYEGAPLTIVEAMSVGLPCIVSDCTSAVELIKDDWDGLLFRSNDVSSLEQKIAYILEEGNAVRIHLNLSNSLVREDYSADAYISNLLHVYSA